MHPIFSSQSPIDGTTHKHPRRIRDCNHFFGGDGLLYWLMGYIFSSSLSQHMTCLAPVVQKVNSIIHRINLSPLDSAIGFPNTYSLDSDLSDG